MGYPNYYSYSMPINEVKYGWYTIYKRGNTHKYWDGKTVVLSEVLSP
jgi:hypothetical protein